jgi:hypothetical protein
VLTLWPHGSTLQTGDEPAVAVDGELVPIDGTERSYTGGVVTGADLGGAAAREVLESCADEVGVSEVWLLSGDAR